MKILEQAVNLFSLQDYDCREVEGHEGGRNKIFVCSKGSEKKFVLRISATGDRTENDYLAESEFAHYLAENGAPVADVIPSAGGKFVEIIDGADSSEASNCTDSVTAGDDGAAPVFLSLFEYAKGMLLCDNGYRYRNGAPLSEYFFNTGKTLGKIHTLSKNFEPVAGHCRPDYFDKYNMEYLGRLIPDKYSEIKSPASKRSVRSLPMHKVMAWFTLTSATATTTSTWTRAPSRSLILTTAFTAGICLTLQISGFTTKAGADTNPTRTNASN